MGKWTQEQKDDFGLKVFKVLSNMMPIEFGQDVPIEDANARQRLMVDEWVKALPPGKEFETVADGLIEFQRFVSTHYLKTGQSKSEYIELSVQLDYGQNGGVITWKIGSQFDVSSPNDRYNAQHSLYQSIGQLRDDFERKTLLRVRGDVPQQPQQVNTLDVVKCSRLIIDIKDGKPAYKIKGGKWEKFGVRAFPEVLKAAGINIDTIPLQGLDMAEWSMEIEMLGTKPDKVKRLVR